MPEFMPTVTAPEQELIETITKIRTFVHSDYFTELNSAQRRTIVDALLIIRDVQYKKFPLPKVKRER